MFFSILYDDMIKEEKIIKRTKSTIFNFNIILLIRFLLYINWLSFLLVSLQLLFDVQRTRVKRKTVYKNVNNMISRIEFLVEKRKGREKFVMFIIHIDNGWFKPTSLFSCKMINGHIMTFVFLWPIRTENAVDDMIGWKRRLS